MRLRSALGLASLAAVSCFNADSVLGLPCQSDDGCGPGYSCELGRCYEAGDDPRDGCGDGEREPGEFCYDDLPAELPIDGLLTGFTQIDLTGDDLLDVIAVVDFTLVLFTQQDDGRFDEDALPDLGQPTAFNENIGTALLAEDLRADQLVGTDAPDLVIVLDGMIFLSPLPELQALQKIAVIENRGAGAAQGFHPIPGTRDVAVGNFSLVTGQFGGGPERDIAFIDGENTDGVYLSLNQGGGSFTEPVRYETRASLVPPAVGRIDDDDIDDIVVMDGMRRNVAILFGLDTGGFTPPMPRSITGTPRGAAVIDTDGDGRNEVVVAHASDNKATLLRLDGNDEIEVETIDGPPSNDIAAADLDGDGLDELVFIGDEETVFRTTLGGELGAQYQLANSAGTRLDFIDLDGDGAPDLLSKVESRLFAIIANP